MPRDDMGPDFARFCQTSIRRVSARPSSISKLGVSSKKNLDFEFFDEQRGNPNYDFLKNFKMASKMID